MLRYVSMYAVTAAGDIFHNERCIFICSYLSAYVALHVCVWVWAADDCAPMIFDVIGQVRCIQRNQVFFSKNSVLHLASVFFSWDV